jgi:ABC-type uncharacterized transport system fused permease/ATPase subunit
MQCENRYISLESALRTGVITVVGQIWVMWNRTGKPNSLLGQHNFVTVPQIFWYLLEFILISVAFVHTISTNFSHLNMSLEKYPDI